MATGMVRTRPTRRRAIMMRLMAMTRRTSGKKRRPRRRLFSFSLDRNSRGELNQFLP